MDARAKTRRRDKWADVAGDRAVLSARGSPGPGQYLQDLDDEMSESVRFQPAKAGERVSSVKPSCCARADEQPELTGRIQLSTGMAEVGYDSAKKDMVISFVRHSLDSRGRQVYENRARTRTVYDRDRFRSNDETFTQGAMELRCNVNKTSRMVMRQFGKVSSDEGGGTTLDRVIPFHRRTKEQSKVRALIDRKNENLTDRTNLHSALSATRTLEAKKQAKNVEFYKKLSRAVSETKEHTRQDDYQLYIKRKWEAMRAQRMVAFPWDVEPPRDDFEAVTPLQNDNQTPKQESLEVPETERS